jgi:DNA-binding MarR family transcriptional regulator
MDARPDNRLRMPARRRAKSQSAFDLANRPGFLIRRLHQIHIALFMEECAGFNVTPVQYSVMSMIAEKPGLEQTSLANEVGVDRATLATVIARLEARGLLRRTTTRADRRLKKVLLTSRGKALLNRMARAARRAHIRTIDTLPAPERTAFVHALARLVDAKNDFGRAPLRLG